jgi:hypothetical protein
MADQQELDRLDNFPRPPVGSSPTGQLSFIVKQTLARLAAAEPPPDVPSNPRENLPSVGQAIVDSALEARPPSDPTSDMTVPLGLAPHRGFIAPGRLPMGGLRWPGS